ncbi:hypothetical protein ACHAWC_005946 [Mediolabrus comicus]
MKQISVLSVVAQAICVGAQQITAAHHRQPQHEQLMRHLQEDDTMDNTSSGGNTISIGGTAFFDIDGNGKLDPGQGDGNINPITNTAISVLAELWSCDTGQNLGYQLTDSSGKYSFTLTPANDLEACYYVRFDSTSMDGTYSCTTPAKCATDNFQLAPGDEDLDVDVGIRSSEFDALAAAVGEDTLVVDEVTVGDSDFSELDQTQPPTMDEDEEEDGGWSIVGGGGTFESLTPAPSAALPSRPGTSPTSPEVPEASVSVTDVSTTETEVTNEGTTTGSLEEDLPAEDEALELIQLNAQLTVILTPMSAPLDVSSEQLFEDACGTFANSLGEIAVPPISNIKCRVISQTVKSERHRHLRNLQQTQRLLQSSLAIDVAVTGVATSTPTINTEEQVKFTDKLIGMFTAQGSQFTKLLKKQEAKVVPDINDAVFPPLDSVSAAEIKNDTAESDGATKSNSNDSSGSSISVAAIAGIAVGGAVLLCVAIFLCTKYRIAFKNDEDYIDDIKGNKSGDTTASPVSPNSISRLPTNGAGQFTTTVMSGSVGVEIGRKASPTDMSARVLRDVIAPRGKLRILVANTQGFGPAIHTIRPNSPVEGLLFVGDIIVAVNDINTRYAKADEITRIFKETVYEERKISVLSLRR